MELTHDQISEFILKATSNSDSFNKLIELILTNLSRSFAEEVEAWLNRELSSLYLAVFIDATFSPTRREDSVRREAYYTTNRIERLNRDYVSSG